MDYSKIFNPVPYHPELLRGAECQYPHIDRKTMIEYEKKHLSFSKDFQKEPIGFIKHPVWEQHPAIPICPVTK